MTFDIPIPGEHWLTVAVALSSDVSPLEDDAMTDTREQMSQALKTVVVPILRERGLPAHFPTPCPRAGAH